MSARDNVPGFVRKGGETGGSPAREVRMSQISLQKARANVAERLRGRRSEIEEAVLARSAALLEPAAALGPEFLDGQRVAVAAAVDYGLAAIEFGEERTPPVPEVFHSHARLTARSGVSLDTMLRRYFAGYTTLGDFLVREAEVCGMQGTALQSVMRGTATVFDRLISTMIDEYSREADGRLNSMEERTAARVSRLLEGELLDTADLGYELDDHHLGAIASGPGVAEAIQGLAKKLDLRLLFVHRGEGAAWAWFGSGRKIDPVKINRLASEDLPSGVTLALGEPAKALTGWRLTHQQASAAFPIAQRSSESVVRYSDVALLASILKDDLLAVSLRERYLAPLTTERDGGEAMRQTLRAYFAAEGNVSSAAAALGVNRHTVASRLRTVEEYLGRPLGTCAAEMDAALRLDDLGYSLLPHAAVTRG